MIAEGHRPGNFKPSAETIAALDEVMRAAGVPPPEKPEAPVLKSGGYPDDGPKPPPAKTPPGR
jgi:hypothetical protein